MAGNVSSSSRSRLWREGAIYVSVAALFLTASLMSASPAPDKPAAGGVAKRGDQIFHTKCIICHNKQPGDNSPFGPPNLYDAFKSNAISTPQAEDIITHGKGQMPSFGNILNKSDMQSVIAYLRSVK